MLIGVLPFPPRKTFCKRIRKLAIARLSFVIPAFNEADYIAAALESVHSAMNRCERPCSYETIVVDDRSSDSTVEVARRHRARVVEVYKRNIAAVRNVGASKAQGEFFIFIDADTQVSHSLVVETIDAMTNGAVWGTALATPADACPLWARCGLTVFNQYYVRWRQCAYGFYFFIHRRAFEQAGGFPEATREGEDMALSKVLVQHHGPPAVLRAPVATSARKARQFGLFYHLRMLWLAFRFGDDIYTRPEIADYRDGERRVGRPR
jgi:glycosyltransferase involved in cell wall biosynthesis